MGYYINFHLRRRVDDDDEAAHTLVFTLLPPKLENGGAESVRISLNNCAAASVPVIGGGISGGRIRT